MAPVQTAPPVDRQSSGRVPPVREWPECWPVSEQRALAEWDTTCGLREHRRGGPAPLRPPRRDRRIRISPPDHPSPSPAQSGARRAGGRAADRDAVLGMDRCRVGVGHRLDPPASLRTASSPDVLCGFSDLQRLDARVWPANLAKASLGEHRPVARPRPRHSRRLKGYTSSSLRGRASPTLAAVVLETRSAHLEEIDEACLWRVYERYGVERKHVCQLSQALCALGVLQDPIRMRTYTLYDAKDSGRVHPSGPPCVSGGGRPLRSPRRRARPPTASRSAWASGSPRAVPGIRQPGD